MTIEKIEFTYPAYVEWLKRKGEHHPALIGVQLFADCRNQSEGAFKTMEDLGFETFAGGDCWQQAGELILNNDTIEI